MLILLLIWLAVGIALIWIVSQRRRDSAGLPLAYFLGLSLIHVPGAILNLEADDADVTRIGFEQTTIGIVAFLVGVMISRPFIRHQGEQVGARQAKNLDPQGNRLLDRLALRYLLVGGIVYFGLLPLISGIPSVTAIISPLGSLIIVGICLRLWIAIENLNRYKLWTTMALLPVLPLATLMHGGFLGFGTYWVIAIVSFLFAQSKRRVFYIMLAPGVFFVGLSLFVNYMAAREEIRSLVWYQQASASDRLDRIANIIRNFAWLDFSNSQHRAAIDGRLNQNFIIGVAVTRLESGATHYLLGDTALNIGLALIPRVLWPDKPAVGGGGTVVADFTGIWFNEYTSVGAGQIFESYINFGSLGVIGGLLLYGWLYGWMDFKIIEYLLRADQKRFLLWFLVSLAMLQPGGNLKEIVVSVIGSILTTFGFGYFLPRSGFAGSYTTSPRGTPRRT
jgi:hypothetical protein